MEKLKKIWSKFWYIIVAIGGGIAAVIFLGGRKKDSNFETVEAVKVIEKEKEKIVSEINELDKKHKDIKDEIETTTEKAKEDIKNTLTEEKTDEEVIDDFNSSW